MELLLWPSVLGWPGGVGRSRWSVDDAVLILLSLPEVYCLPSRYSSGGTLNQAIRGSGYPKSDYPRVGLSGATPGLCPTSCDTGRAPGCLSRHHTDTELHDKMVRRMVAQGPREILRMTCGLLAPRAMTAV